MIEGTADQAQAGRLLRQCQDMPFAAALASCVCLGWSVTQGARLQTRIPWERGHIFFKIKHDSSVSTFALLRRQNQIGEEG
jgi:hypothetical protein